MVEHKQSTDPSIGGREWSQHCNESQRSLAYAQWLADILRIEVDSESILVPRAHAALVEFAEYARQR
ncbi:MAG: hypothetical protein EXS03_07800 [Phycisphaerales bacterium]|nr:hypothetical protein [Phycisphaerales bacterium]